MLGHHWSVLVTNRFREENGLATDDPVIGNPALVSDSLLFDDGVADGEQILEECSLKLYLPSLKQVLSKEFESFAVYVTMIDDSRTLADS